MCIGRLSEPPLPFAGFVSHSTYIDFEAITLSPNAGQSLQIFFTTEGAENTEFMEF